MRVSEVISARSGRLTGHSTGRWYPRFAGGDAGVASVWTAMAIAVLMVVAGMVFWMGSAAVARHRAANTADLAALAAAAYAARGVEVACGKARWVIRHMDAELRDCHLDGLDALVRVVLVPDGFLGRFGAAHAHARAGPVDVRRGSHGGIRTTSGTTDG